MGFQTAWTEQMDWLEKSINNLEILYKACNVASERTRLWQKRHGLKTALEHMKDSERIYNLCTHENAVLEEELQYYCGDCNRRFFDYGV